MLARWGLTRATLHTEGLIWMTVGINVVGSFLLGLLVAEQLVQPRDTRRAWGRAARRASRRSPRSLCKRYLRLTAGGRASPSPTSWVRCSAVSLRVLSATRWVRAWT